MSAAQKPTNIQLIGFFIVLALVGGLAVWDIVCDRNDKQESKLKPTATVQPLIDQKQQLIDSLLSTVNKLVASVNSSKQTVVVERAGFQNTYQNALQTSPEVCLPVINLMYKQALKVDSVNQVVIKKQDSTIVNLYTAAKESQDVISLQKFQLQQKSDSIAGILETKRQEEKRDKRQKVLKTIKNIGTHILSFGAGYGAGKVIP